MIKRLVFKVAPLRISGAKVFTEVCTKAKGRGRKGIKLLSREDYKEGLLLSPDGDKDYWQEKRVCR